LISGTGTGSVGCGGRWLLAKTRKAVIDERAVVHVGRSNFIY
jgi:hypothetical protein